VHPQDLRGSRPRRSAREELEETKIGRLAHKIEKLKVVARPHPRRRVPEDGKRSAAMKRRQPARSSPPFGVIGAITPRDALAADPRLLMPINMACLRQWPLVCNPHPSGARIACKGTQAVQTGPISRRPSASNNLMTESSATARRWNRRRPSSTTKGPSRWLCVTGRPRPSARAALREARKRAHRRRPRPTRPVVVDETADPRQTRARSIIIGGGYDNNLLCIGEKEVFAVASHLR